MLICYKLFLLVVVILLMASCDHSDYIDLSCAVGEKGENTVFLLGHKKFHLNKIKQKWNSSFRSEEYHALLLIRTGWDSY